MPDRKRALALTTTASGTGAEAGGEGLPRLAVPVPSTPEWSAPFNQLSEHMNRTHGDFRSQLGLMQKNLREVKGQYEETAVTIRGLGTQMEAAATALTTVEEWWRLGNAVLAVATGSSSCSHTETAYVI